MSNNTLKAVQFGHAYGDGQLPNYLTISVTPDGEDIVAFITNHSDPGQAAAEHNTDCYGQPCYGGTVMSVGEVAKLLERLKQPLPPNTTLEVTL